MTEEFKALVEERDALIQQAVETRRQAAVREEALEALILAADPDTAAEMRAYAHL